MSIETGETGSPGATFNNVPDLVPADESELGATEIEPTMNDINRKVIEIQKADGIDVGPEWWKERVAAVVEDDADEQIMFDRFMIAYNEDFPRGDDGKRRPVQPLQS